MTGLAFISTAKDLLLKALKTREAVWFQVSAHARQFDRAAFSSLNQWKGRRRAASWRQLAVPNLVRARCVPASAKYTRARALVHQYRRR